MEWKDTTDGIFRFLKRRNLMKNETGVLVLVGDTYLVRDIIRPLFLSTHSSGLPSHPIDKQEPYVHIRTVQNVRGA